MRGENRERTGLQRKLEDLTVKAMGLGTENITKHILRLSRFDRLPFHNHREGVNSLQLKRLYTHFSGISPVYICKVEDSFLQTDGLDYLT